MKAQAALELVLQLLLQAQQISTMVLAAQAQGRDLTPAEWAGITQDNDAARARLVEAIERAEQENR